MNYLNNSAIEESLNVLPGTGGPVCGGPTNAAGLGSIGFLVGQVMKASRGQANAALVQEALRARLGDAGSGEG